MLSLNKFTKQRSQGADTVVIPESVLEENIATIEKYEVQQILQNRHFPFNKCLLKFMDDNSETYFEVTDINEIALIRDMKTSNNVVFSAIINIDTYRIGDLTDSNLMLSSPDIRVAAFRGHERLQMTQEQRDDVSQSLAFELVSVLCVFAYINKVCLAEPELQEKAVTRSGKKKKKNGTPVRYISTRKYTLTGQERKSRRKTPRIYTRDEWQTRGHWRNYKTGHRVWIKPHTNKRDKDKLSGKKVDARIYKVGV